jgi:ribosome-interacting GTPase 1
LDCIYIFLFFLIKKNFGVPGIIEGASQGKGKPNLVNTSSRAILFDLQNNLGRGRQVIAVAKTADLILMMLDATKGDIQVSCILKHSQSALFIPYRESFWKKNLKQLGYD